MRTSSTVRALVSALVAALVVTCVACAGQDPGVSVGVVSGGAPTPGSGAAGSADSPAPPADTTTTTAPPPPPPPTAPPTTAPPEPLPPVAQIATATAGADHVVDLEIPVATTWRSGGPDPYVVGRWGWVWRLDASGVPTGPVARLVPA